MVAATMVVILVKAATPIAKLVAAIMKEVLVVGHKVVVSGKDGL